MPKRKKLKEVIGAIPKIKKYKEYKKHSFKFELKDYLRFKEKKQKSKLSYEKFILSLVDKID